MRVTEAAGLGCPPGIVTGPTGSPIARRLSSGLSRPLSPARDTCPRCDDALQRLPRLGGRVLVPAHDGAHGRVAQVTDPDGTRFALLRRPR
ncbi:hypothetical protein SAMN05216532_8111 [Streptomyces sp. 2231.1]|nr:hypothetical protein SAMN05216532_8111 [Streptomyces sp. 2231.1]